LYGEGAWPKANIHAKISQTYQKIPLMCHKIP
jgi:hypothetical protein